MSSYSSSFFLGDQAPDAPEFGKAIRHEFLLEEGTGGVIQLIGEFLCVSDYALRSTQLALQRSPTTAPSAQCQPRCWMRGCDCCGPLSPTRTGGRPLSPPLTPFRWFRRLLRPLYDAALAEVARFVGADPANLVFVQNATTAVNTVLKSLVLGPEDSILANSHSYNACNMAIESTVKRCGANTLCLDLRFPANDTIHISDSLSGSPS
jgi:hypothetical protein